VIATAQGRGGRTVRIVSPLAGTLIQTNPLLDVAPHALVPQPYKKGWVARIWPRSWDALRLDFGGPAVARYRRLPTREWWTALATSCSERRCCPSGRAGRARLHR
jgi:hypothetical protein